MLPTGGISCILLAQDGTSSALGGLHCVRAVGGTCLPSVQGQRCQFFTAFCLISESLRTGLGLCSVVPGFVFLLLLYS